MAKKGNNGLVNVILFITIMGLVAKFASFFSLAISAYFAVNVIKRLNKLK